MNVELISKKTHEILNNGDAKNISLTEATVVIVYVAKNNVKAIEKVNKNVVIILMSGEKIIIENFFKDDSNKSDNTLVLENDDTRELLWVKIVGENGELLNPISYNPIQSIEPFLYEQTDYLNFVVPLLAGGAAIAAFDHQNKDDAQTDTYIPPVVVPEKPDVPKGYEDNVGDLQGTFPGGTTTDDNTPGIVVVVPEGDTPNLIVNGEEVPSIYDKDKGTLTPVDPLPEGDNEISYTVTNPAGNTSEPSDSITITVDTSPVEKPDAPSGYEDNVGDVQGTFPGGTTTDDNRPGILVNVPEGDTPQLIVDGEEVPSIYDKDKGTLTPINPLPDGDHEISYTVTNPAGNTSEPSDSITITVDTSPVEKPDAPSGYEDNVGDVQGTFPGGTTTDDNRPGILVNVPEGDTPQLIVDGEEVPSIYDKDKGTLTPVDPLPDGDHEISYTVTNPAGNTSEPSDSIIITVDASGIVRPDAPEGYYDNVGDLQGKFESGTTTDDSTPSLIIPTPPEGSTPTLLVDGEVVESTYDAENGYLTPLVALPDGSHKLSYTLTNAAGNVSEPSDSITITVDTRPVEKPDAPSGYEDNVGDVQGTFPGGTTTDDNTPGIVVVVPEGDTPNLIVNGEEVPSIYDKDKGTLTPVDPLPEGDNEISYTVTNPAGNTSEPSDSITITVDTRPVEKPDAPSGYEDNVGDVQGTFPGGTTTDDNTPGIVVVVPEGDTPNLIVNGEEVPSIYDKDKGTLTPVDPLPEGDNEISYTVTNPAGNTSEPSDSITITVDTSPVEKPDAPSGYEDNVGDVQGTFPGGTTTDDNRPGILVNVPEGDTPQLIVDGEEVPSIYDKDKGTLTPVDPLPDGDHEISYTVTNPAGNTSEPSDSIIITVDASGIVRPDAPEGYYDNVGDLQGKFESGTTTDDSTPSLIIPTPPEGSTPTLLVDGEVVESTYDAENGYLTPLVALPDGSYKLSYTLTNAAGNVSEPSDSITITVDTSPVEKPDAPSGYEDNVGDVQGTFPGGTTTDDNRPGILVNVPEGDTPQLIVDGEEVPSIYDKDKGTLTPVDPLPDGDHEISYTVTNPAGNTSEPSDSIIITVDASGIVRPDAPEGYYDNVGDLQGKFESGTTTDDSTPSLIIPTPPEGSTPTLLVDGEVVESTYDAENGYLTPLVALPDGSHKLSYTLTNAAGNVSEPSDSITITVDTRPVEKPDAPSGYEDNVGDVQGTFPGGTTTDDNTPGIVVVVPEGDTPNLIVNGEEVPSIYDKDKGTLTPVDPLPEGDNEISYTVTNPAGNTSEPSDSITITVDTRPVEKPDAPSGYEDNVGDVQGTFPGGTTTDDNTPGIVVVVPEGDTPNLIVNGEEVPSIYDKDKGTLTPVDPLPEGDNEISYTVTNPAGNTSEPSDSITITVDTRPVEKPDAPSGYEDNVGDVQGTFPGGTTTDDNRPGILVNVPEGDTPQLIVDGEEVPSIYDKDKGTLTPVDPLPDGDHEISYTVTNPAGNTSEPSDSIIITVDASGIVRPDAPEGYYDNVGDLQGKFESGTTTDDSTPSLIIPTPPEGSTPTLLVDGEVVESTYDAENGYLTPLVALPDGSYKLSYTLTNAAGNVSEPSDSITITVDTRPVEKPDAPSGYEDNVGDVQGTFPGGTTTDDNTPGIVVVVPEGDTPNLIVNGEEVPSIYDKDKGTLTPVDPLPEGDNEISYTVTNPAGNTSEPSDSITITVDTSPVEKPDAPSGYEDNVGDVQGTFPGGTTTDDNTPGIVVVVPEGDTPNLIVNGEEVPSIYDKDKGTLTPVDPLPEGDNEISYTVTNPAGNTSEPSDSITITVDTRPVEKPDAPSGYEDNVGDVQGTFPGGTTTDDNTPGIVVVVPEGDTPNLIVNGEEVPSIYDKDKGTLTPVDPLPEGDNEISYTVTNPAGNTSEPSDSITITVDTRPVEKPDAPSGYEDNVGDVQGTFPGGTTTDDNTPGIVVVVPEGDTPNLIVNGEEVPSIYDKDKGTLTPVDPLPEGDNEISYTVTNPAGNTSEPSDSITITVDTRPVEKPDAPSGYEDNVGDVQGTFPGGTTTDDNTPGIVVVVPEGDTPNLIVNGEEVPSIYDKDKGTLTPVDPLPEGDNEISYTVTNPAGNTSEPSDSITITVDTSPVEKPDAPSGYEDNVGDVQGTFPGGTTTDDNRPGILVNVPEGDTPQLIVDGEEVPSIYDKDKGTLTPVDPLPDGDHEISYTVTNPSGNTSEPSDSIIITVDASGIVRPDAPEGYYDNVGDLQGKFESGTTTDDSTPSLIIPTPPEGSTPTLLVDGEVVESTYDAENGYLTPLVALPDGSHKLSYTLTNAAGNVSEPSDSITITVDTRPVEKPDAPSGYEDNVGDVQGTFPGGTTTDDNTPGIVVVVPEGDTPNLIVNGEEVPSIYDKDKGTLTPVDPLPEGDNEISYTVTNPAGNTSEPSDSITITVDTSPVEKPDVPSGYEDNVGDVQGTFPGGTTTDDNTPGIVVVVPEGDTPNLIVNGEEVPSIYDKDKGTLTPVDPLPEGDNEISYTVTNPAGNTSEPSDSITITVDTSPVEKPDVPSGYEDNVGDVQGTFPGGTTTDDNTPGIVVVVPEGDTPNLIVNGEEVPSIYDKDKGTLTPVDPLPEGDNEISYTVTNPAGNTSEPSDSITITVDTSPVEKPDAPSGYEDNVGDVQGTFPGGTTTDDNTPGIVVVVPEGDTPNLIVNGEEVPSIYDKDKGTLTPVDPLPEGDNEISYTVTNPAGNTSEPSDSITITVDTSPVEKPDAPSGYEDNVGDVQGTFPGGTTTDDNTPGIVVVVPEGDTPNLIVNGEEVPSIYDKDKGTLTPVDPLPEGDNEISYTVTNPAGNTSEPSDSIIITVDTIPPSVEGITNEVHIDIDTANGVPESGFTDTITARNDDLITRDSNPSLISGSLNIALKAGETIQLSFDGGETWNTVTTFENQKDWTYQFDKTYENDTEININFRVVNSIGNSSRLEGQDAKIIIDLTSPTGIAFAPEVSSLTDVTEIFTFDSEKYGLLEAGATIALVNDVNNNTMWQEGIDTVIASAVVNADGAWSIETTLPAGALNLAFLVWDKAGNISEMSTITHTGVSSSDTGSESVEATWGGTTDAGGRGINAAAATISKDGTWSFFQSVRAATGTGAANAGRVYTQEGDLEDYTSAYLAQPSTTNGAGYNLNGGGYGHFVNAAVFADINRDGLVDVMSQVSDYGNSGRTAYWMQQEDGSWLPQVVNQGTLNHLGGVIAYDRTGDGYLDFVLADSAPDSISFLKNEEGVLSPENNGNEVGRPPSSATTVMNGLGTAGVTGVSLDGLAGGNLSVMHEIGAVDIDNNGTVDITAHIDRSGTGTGGRNNGQNMGMLYNTGTEEGFTFIQKEYIFAPDAGDDYGNLSQSMTWADFNGDGWLDLYLNRGADKTTQTRASSESRIYLNDGTGQLKTDIADTIWFGDEYKGATSFAVDWNFDGLVDVIEVPAQVNNSNFSPFSPMLYTNNGTNEWGANAISLTGDVTYSNVTGAVVVDYDWDGSLDLLLYHSGTNAAVVSTDNSAPTTIVRNTNIAADGTSLNIRIVDGHGINTYYSNTVKLYNSAGELVSTQLINPQSSGSSNSMGLVSFYGLSATESYSIQLLRVTNGVTDHVGGVANLGGYNNATINSSWTGLTTSKANEAYVLTAEADTAINDSNNNSVGIVGTGYNDHFYGTLGNDHYNGGGGWIINENGNQWVAQGGQDILDYSLLNAKISINVSTKTVIKNVDGTVYTDTFENIEKFITGSGDTVFTGGDEGDHYFVGGQGDDTYNLGENHTGNDTLYFTLLDADDATGGNGTDIVNGFKIGQDIIDIHELLTDYTETVGLYEDLNGDYKLDVSSEKLLQYVKVSNEDGNTFVAIDRDGEGTNYNFTTVLTITNLETDLITLLQNNQLVV
ncbi:Ig-like domain repeat protein [Acinetobacter equi]|uniref:Cyclic nucleotide-binding domain-containing protein n=1 Tax=Acinetobacter equi TaxID=1324350 RepID=A0A0N9WEJ5_9GAMM|nr:Ig-like domain repeat protein [Acinetobacter equi]ALH95750.1 hypothetical protein AOY20_09525 [Acinetobacter equi]